MITRNSTSVVVVATLTTHAGEQQTALYGPFLPHAGSATQHFLEKLDRELNESGRYQNWELNVETVFIGEDESDCAIRATQ